MSIVLFAETQSAAPEVELLLRSEMIFLGASPQLVYISLAGPIGNGHFQEQEERGEEGRREEGKREDRK